MERKTRKKIMPKEVPKEEVETAYLIRDQWDAKPSRTQRVHVKMILPNFRVKGGNVYFILEPEMWIVLDKMFVEDQFLMEANDTLISVQYRLYTEEDPRGLRCEVMIEDQYDLYHGDYQFIGKLVELDILGVNPEKTYQLLDYRQELSKKKKKIIPKLRESEMSIQRRKHIIPIEDSDD